MQTVKFLTMLCKFAFPIINMWIFCGVVQLKKDTFTFIEIYWSIVFVAFVTFLCCILFLDIYNEIIVALVICLAVDMDLNDQDPQFGPIEIHQKLEYVFNFHQKKMIYYANRQLNGSQHNKKRGMDDRKLNTHDYFDDQYKVLNEMKQFQIKKQNNYNNMITKEQNGGGL